MTADLGLVAHSAEGDANKLWIIPSELTEALKTVGQGFLGGAQRDQTPPAP